MSRRRFRLLERGPDLKAGDGGDDRASHFCPACEAEVSHGARRCYNCGGDVGGPGQADFDERVRTRLAARRAEQERERSHAEDGAAERARLERALAEHGLLPEREGGAPRSGRRGLPADLGVVVVGVCLFGTVSALLHLYLSAMWSDAIHWSPIAEVAIAVLVTWSAFQYLK